MLCSLATNVRDPPGGWPPSRPSMRDNRPCCQLPPDRRSRWDWAPRWPALLSLVPGIGGANPPSFQPVHLQRARCCSIRCTATALGSDGNYPMSMVVDGRAQHHAGDQCRQPGLRAGRLPAGGATCSGCSAIWNVVEGPGGRGRAEGLSRGEPGPESRVAVRAAPVAC